MARGYTISSLDSNESILEKLNKIEKYLKDNPLCNLYMSKQTYPTGSNYTLYSNILTSNIKPLINNGDLILFKNGFVGMVTAVDIDNDMVYYDNDNIIQIADGDHYVTGVEVLNPTPTTAQIKIDIAGATSQYSNIFNIGGGGGGAGIDSISVSEVGNQATITITDTDNNTYTSNAFNVGDTNTDTLISSVVVTNPTPTTAQIEITDTASNTYTSNTFNVGGGGSESVFVDSDNNIVSNNAVVQTNVNDSILLGDNATSYNDECICLGKNTSCLNDNSIAIGKMANNSGTMSQYSIAIGYNATNTATNSIAIGSGSQNLGMGCVAIGSNAMTNAVDSIQLGTGTNNVNMSIQFMTEQILSKATNMDPVKFANPLQLHCYAVPVIINSFTDNFATASANGIQVTCDSNDSTHAQVTLTQLTSDSSVLEDNMVFGLYYYTDMTDPDNPSTEYTWCIMSFSNYDSQNNVCDCMVLPLAQSYTI